MEEKRNFTENCAEKFRSAGGLALQTVLKERLIEKHGASWWDFLRAHISEHGKDDAPGMTSYRNALVSLTGGEKTFSQLEITVLFASLKDLELLSDEEYRVARRINEHRRGVGHDAETDTSKNKEREEMYNAFWIESSKTLQDAIEVFGFTGEVKARIEAYCDARTYDPGSAPSHEAQYEQANDYIHNGQKAKGIVILKELAEKKHIKSITLLAEICLNGVDFPEMFNPEKAEEYCLKALLLTNSKESLMSGIIKEFNELLELAKHDAKANLKLIEMTDNNPLIKVNEQFVLERLLCAHKLGAENAMELIKKHLIEHGYSQDAAIHLARYGEYEFITDFFINSNLPVEELRRITRPCDELWKHHLEAVYICRGEVSDKKELREFLRSGNEFLSPVWENATHTAYPAEYLYLIAVIYKRLGDFREVLLLLKTAVDTSEYELCRKMYEEYCEQALRISPDSEDAERWYEVSALLPAEIQQKLADEFWKAETDKLVVLTSTSKLVKMKSNARGTGEFFKYESPMIAAYNEKFEAVLAETEIEEEKERKRMAPILRERAEQSRRMEEERERYKLELKMQIQRKYEERRRQEEEEKKRKEEERRRELEEIVGKKYEKGYWSNLDKAENDAKKICALKEKYTSVIGEMSWEFWRDENKLKSRLAEIDRRKEKYSAFFSGASNELWQSDENVKAGFIPVFGSLTDKIWRDTDSLTRYYNAYNAYLENQEIVRCKTWTADTGFSLGNPDRYVPDEVNWEFWLDEKALKNELRAFAAKESWENKYGEHNRNYWFDNLEKLEKAEEKRKASIEKSRLKRDRALHRRRQTRASFSRVSDFLKATIIPSYAGSLGFGFGFAVMCVILHFTFGSYIVNTVLGRGLSLLPEFLSFLFPYILMLAKLLVSYYILFFIGNKKGIIRKSFYAKRVAPLCITISFAVITVPVILLAGNLLFLYGFARNLAFLITQLPLLTLIAAKIKEQ